MLRRTLCVFLLCLLLLTPTAHADVIFPSPQGLSNQLIREKSIILPVEEREYIALTDLTGWQHPHVRKAICSHEIVTVWNQA